MGNRLSKIYTRTGDDGTTALADGARVNKSSAELSAIGSIDELNSHMGLLRAQVAHLEQGKNCTSIDHEISVIQHLLFNLGGELAMPKFTTITDAHTTMLEQWLDTQNSTLPPLKDFILPAGSMAAAQAHVCRSVCRRAERELITLAQTASIRAELMRFVNRLSDYLFVLARTISRLDGDTEVLWDKSMGYGINQS